VLCSYGNYLLSFTGSGELELISWEKMQVVASTSVLLSKPLCISLAPDTTKFAVGNLDSTISIFRTRDVLRLGTFHRHKSDVDEVSYLSDSEVSLRAPFVPTYGWSDVTGTTFPFSLFPIQHFGRDRRRWSPRARPT